MKGCLRSILVFMLMVVAINILFSIFGGKKKTYYRVPTSDPACDEFVMEDEFTGDRDHQRFWGFRELPATYCLSYGTTEDQRASEENRRGNLEASYADENFWGPIYAQLIEQTGSKLNFLADSLLNVAGENGYTDLDLARLIVSFVQDIPYSFVIPSSCEEYSTGSKPCIGNIPYGIVSPYEFAHSLHGDCDTRAVLLYVLLEHLNFDPMIVVSSEYAHAMLALNIPAQGDYLLYRGRKYYFWETTAEGWGIGMLPPDTNNIDYWKIALVNES